MSPPREPLARPRTERVTRVYESANTVAQSCLMLTTVQPSAAARSSEAVVRSEGIIPIG